MKRPIVDVVFYLRGQHLDPDLVSLSLGIKGSKMRKKGDKWNTSTGHEVVAKIGLWSLVAKVNSYSLSDQILWLKEQLSSAKCTPLEIAGVQEAELSVYIELGSDDEGDGNYESRLTIQDLEWLSNLGVFVSFKISHCTT